MYLILSRRWGEGEYNGDEIDLQPFFQPKTDLLLIHQRFDRMQWQA